MALAPVLSAALPSDETGTGQIRENAQNARQIPHEMIESSHSMRAKHLQTVL